MSGLRWGKIRAIINDKGNNVDNASPSTPVEILGINGAAKAGDDFIVLETEKEAKTLSENRDQENKEGKILYHLQLKSLLFQINHLKN